MTLLYSIGFDGTNSSTDLVGGNMTGQSLITGTIVSSTRFGVGKALALHYLYGSSVWKTLQNPVNTIFVGAAINYSNSSTPGYIALADVVGVSNYFHIYAITDTMNARICLYRAVGQSNNVSNDELLGSTPANSVSQNVWFYIEIGATIGSSGSAQLYINGIEMLNLTGVNTKGGAATNNSVQAVYLGQYNDGGNVYFDDMYVCDNSGDSPFNTFLGPIQIYSLFPNGAGSLTQFTPLSGANWQEVNNTTFNNGVTFNSSSTVGAADLFTLQALPSNLVPLAVVTKLSCAQANAGTHTMESLLKSGSTTVDGQVLAAFQGGYHMQSDIWELNPNGNIPWTNTTVNAAQIGYQIVS